MTWKLQGRSRIMELDETLILLCFSNGVYKDGKLQINVTGKKPFQANVQPMSGRELLLVPEHQRFKEQYWCFVPENCFRNSGEKTGDIVHRCGVHYQVQEIDNWGSYQRARIMRVDVGAYATP